MPVQATAKDHLLDLDGIEVAVRSWGAEDGVPVLALHGWMDNAASFERLAPALDGCFVLAPDLIGHGRSDHRRDDSGYYIWQHAEDMLAVAERLGLHQYHVLAHGMGTGIASIMAALSSAVVSVVFLDGMGVPFTVADEQRLDHFARAYRLNRLVRRTRLDDASLPDAAHLHDIDTALSQRRDRLGNGLSDAAQRLLVQRDLLAVGTGYRWRHDPRVALPEPMPLSEREACELLGQIACPLTLMLARDGQFGDESYRRRQWALPRHAQVSWHAGGHHFHLEQPSAALVSQVRSALVCHAGVERSTASGAR